MSSIPYAGLRGALCGPDGSCLVAHGTYHDRRSVIYNVKGVQSANLRT
jgi:hypothetical protein